MEMLYPGIADLTNPGLMMLSSMRGRVSARREALKGKKIDSIQKAFADAFAGLSDVKFSELARSVLPEATSCTNGGGYGELELSSQKARQKAAKKGNPIRNLSDWSIHGFESVDIYHNRFYGSLSGNYSEQIRAVAKKGYNIKSLSVSVSKKILWASETSRDQFLSEMKKLGFAMAPRSDENRLFLHDEKNRPVAYVLVDDDLSCFRATFVDHELAKKVADVSSKHILLEKDSVKLTTIKGIGALGLDTSDETLSVTDSLVSPSAFYPWMEGTEVGQYFGEFMESESNVLLLYGLAGTGKSSLIRSGLIKTGVSALAITDSSLASKADIVSKLGELMKSGDYGVLVIEDADALMIPRSEGNLTLNKLLSATSGIGDKGTFKIILTTNALTTERIDSALLRPGRCFDVMEFGRMTSAQANAARKAVGLDPVKITGSVILAAALSDSPSQTMKSANDNATSICSPRFPLAKNTRKAA